MKAQTKKEIMMYQVIHNFYDDCVTTCDFRSRVTQKTSRREHKKVITNGNEM